MSESECGSWANNQPLALAYHSDRWCKPIHEETELFAMLCLEGQQAGLSWSTILKKEAAIRKAFDGFDIDKVEAYTNEKVEELMQNPQILRNRQKICSAIKNAAAIKKLIGSGEYASFNDYIWHFTDNQQIIHHPKKLSDVAAQDELSEMISKDLKKRGFTFVGPVIIYSYLQAIGIYDDHLEDCPYKSNK